MNTVAMSGGSGLAASSLLAVLLKAASKGEPSAALPPKSPFPDLLPAILVAAAYLSTLAKESPCPFTTVWFSTLATLTLLYRVVRSWTSLTPLLAMDTVHAAVKIPALVLWVSSGECLHFAVSGNPGVETTVVVMAVISAVACWEAFVSCDGEESGLIGTFCKAGKTSSAALVTIWLLCPQHRAVLLFPAVASMLEAICRAAKVGYMVTSPCLPVQMRKLLLVVEIVYLSAAHLLLAVGQVALSMYTQSEPLFLQVGLAMVLLPALLNLHRNLTAQSTLRTPSHATPTYPSYVYFKGATRG